MLTRRGLLACSLSFFATTALATPALATRYVRAPRGAPVTSLLVRKSERTLFLLHTDKVVDLYRVHLGHTPLGHKTQQGDGRTPEGMYTITHRNPRSRFHLSLGISYPNTQDRRQAAARGVSPGGDIFLHGRGPNAIGLGRDWTEGCIAVEDAEMEAIYAKVRPRTPIRIVP